MTEDARIRRVHFREQSGSVAQDLVVADMEKLLGPGWQDALKDEWKLRGPIKADFTYLDEDWDWVEFYPGNVQTDSMHILHAGQEQRHQAVDAARLQRVLGADEQQVQANESRCPGPRLPRQRRTASTSSMFPEARMPTGRIIIIEVMRGVGKEVTGMGFLGQP